jgi:hypothetical protein
VEAIVKEGSQDRVWYASGCNGSGQSYSGIANSARNIIRSSYNCRKQKCTCPTRNQYHWEDLQTIKVTVDWIDVDCVALVF